MTPPRFLLLEDNGSDAERVQALLTDGGVDHELLRVDTGASFVTALETQTFDLILAAYGIPGLDGIAALEIALNLQPETPFIFVSASLGEELAIETLKQGATDYVLKQRLERLVPAVQRALREAQEWQAAPRQYAHAEALLQASHDTFRQLVENSPFGIYVVDADFRLVQVSAGAQKVFENVRPLIGRDFAKVLRALWSEPFASEAIALFRHTLETGEPYRAPNTVERRYDIGEVESYDWKIERIALPDGRFGVVCHFYDLSERQRYETALRESEEQFRNMADSSPVLIWQTDATGVTFVNRHYLEFFAQLFDDVKGMGWANFLHPDDAAAYAGTYRTAFERQEQYEFQCRFLRHDGEYRWLQNFGKPHYGLDHTFLGFVGCSVDVTDIKAAAEISQRTAKLDAFRVSLTDALRPLADPIEIQSTATCVLGEYLGANRVAYFEVRDADYVVERDYVKVADPLAGRYPIDSFDPRQLVAFRQGRTATSSNVPADPNLSPEQRSAFAALQVDAYIGVPLIKQGEFVAGLAVHTTEPRVWTANDIALTEEVAERTWAAVERARAEAALRESEARLVADLAGMQRLYDLYAMLATEPDLKTALDEILAVACEFTHTERGCVQLVSDDGTRLEMFAWRGYSDDSPFINHFRYEGFKEGCDRARVGRQRFIIEETIGYPGLEGTEAGAAADAEGIRAAQSTPIMNRSGEAIGVLSTQFSQPHRPSDDELRLVDLLAWIADDFIERYWAYTALRQSEEKYRSLFESIDEAFCLLEMLFDANDKAYDYRFVEINQAFEQQSGLVDAVGKTILELVPNFEPQWAELYGQVAKSSEAVRFEADVPSMNRIFDAYAFPSGAPGQNLVAVLFNDITDRKRREANLVFLAEIQDDCARLTTADAMMQTVSAKIGTYLNLSVCAFVDIDEAQDQAIIAYSWHRADVSNLVGTYRVSEFVSEEFYIAARAGAVVIVNDTNTDARTDAENCAAIGVQAFIHVPFRRDGQWKFLFNVYDSRPRDWRDDEIELFSELANRILPRLERTRTEAALHESEERLRLFVTASSDMMYRMSAGWSEMHHLAGKDFLASTESPSRTWLEQYIPPAVQPQVLAAIEAAIRTKSPFELEHQVIQLDGTVGWTFSRAIPLLDAQNEIIEWFGAANNITGRKQTEAIIATDLENTRLLRDLSARLITEDNIQVLYNEIMAAAIALTKADAGTVQILDNATQDLVLLASQGFDQSMTDHFYRVDASSNTSCGIALTCKTRSFIDFDVPECDDPDGSLRMHVNAGYLSAQSTPLISRSGKAIGMFSTHWCRQHRPSDRELRFLDLLARQAADLIEQRQTEAERQQILQREQAAREEAERANRIKDEFLAVLSHELRSPLNPILGWTRLLQNGKLDEARRVEALKTIERNAKLQTQLIEDLLDISRIMQGKLCLTATPVNLTTVIPAAVETVRLAAEAKNIQIALDLDPAIAPISGDAARLQQVAWNLLSNAVKFTSSGGQVTVELRQLDHLAQIRVIDTGKGIAPDFLPHVFEYFRQEDGSTTRKFGGLGLGLAIVRQIVELHGGTVVAESQGEGQGATVTVRLPLLRSRKLEVGSRESSNNSPSPIPYSPLTDLRILVVDDEPDSRDFVAFVLEQAGAIVTSVSSGIEALQAIEQSAADLIVSDIGMPNMDGYMLLQQIRELEPMRQLPAIALTAYAGEFDRQQAIVVGFQQHLAKPVEPEALVRTIATLTGGN